MNTSVLSRGMVMLLMVGSTLLVGVPLVTEAATVHPTCTLSVTVDGVTTPVRSGTKVPVRAGAVFGVSWSAQNADSAVDRGGHAMALQGSTSTVLTATTNYALRFSKSGYQATCSVSAYAVSGSITSGTAASSSKSVTIVGKARGLDTLLVTVLPFGTTTAISSKTIAVRHGVFTYIVPQKLPDGLYQILVTTTKSGVTAVIATSTLNVGAVPVLPQFSPTTVVVIPVPLLIGGIAHPGATVAVAYLQVINIGVATTSITNITLTQSGTAPAAAIVGLTTISDNGVAHGAVGDMQSISPFVGNVVTVPLGLTLAPKEMRLVTIKAVTTKNILPYLGMKVTLLVSGVGTAAHVQSTLPLFGTVWTFGY